DLQVARGPVSADRHDEARRPVPGRLSDQPGSHRHEDGNRRRARDRPGPGRWARHHPHRVLSRQPDRREGHGRGRLHRHRRDGAAETAPGRPADPVYFERVATATLISEALLAYNGERYQDALGLYRNAAATPAGEQLRVVNGVYLSTWKLGRVKEAEEAFGNV